MQERDHPGFLTQDPEGLCNWVDMMASSHPGMVPEFVAESVRATYVGKPGQPPTHPFPSSNAAGSQSKPGPTSGSEKAAAKGASAAASSKAGSQPQKPPPVSKSGIAAAASTAAASKPAKQQEKASSGLAKGFLSKSTGLGVKEEPSSPPARTTSWQPDGGPQIDMAVEGHACRVWTAIPDCWYQANQATDRETAHSLFKLRKQTHEFQEHYSRRSKALPRTKEAPMRDSLVRSHVERIIARSNEVETIVCNLQTLEQDYADGSDAFRYTEALQEELQKSYVTSDEDGHFYSLMRDLKVSI